MNWTSVTETHGNGSFLAKSRGPQSGPDWCVFTSAGDRNSIRLWVNGDVSRRWDLIVAYYGDSNDEFSELERMATYAFRMKGGKFQNLKKLVSQEPQFFDRYSLVCVSDDDIKMSVSDINEAFAITDFYRFWIAQPAFLPEGKISHSITKYCEDFDYRMVNFIECALPIFRTDKLIQFLNAYDGSLTGFGIDWWYMNVFRANKLSRLGGLFKVRNLGRFAIIDKVRVINPNDSEKGGREIDRLQSTPLRKAEWLKTKIKYGLIEFGQKTFASCSLSSHRKPGVPVTLWDSTRHLFIHFMQRTLFSRLSIRKKTDGHGANLNF